MEIKEIVKKHIGKIILVFCIIMTSFFMINSTNKNNEILITDNSKKEENRIIENNSKDIIINTSSEDEVVKEQETVTVFLSGEIKNKKVVTLPLGSRLEEAVKECGGLTEFADINRINLALKLEDEGHYIMPKIGEEIQINDALSQNQIDSPTKNGKVNLNTADISNLITLDGVGEKTAQKIIDYRQSNGKFNKIEDLKNISGIGDKKFNAIKDKVTI